MKTLASENTTGLRDFKNRKQVLRRKGLAELLHMCMQCTFVLCCHAAVALGAWPAAYASTWPTARQPFASLYTHYILFDEYFPFPLTIRACTSFHMHA